MRGGGEELIEGAAPIRLEMRERNPAQALQRQYVGYGILHF
jgi:hypothetical protein